MKCIKAIRTGKNHETGDIKRIEDVEAESRVRGGSWVYVPKSEWKVVNRKQKEEAKQKAVNDQITDAVTQSPKKEKFKKGKK